MLETEQRFNRPMRIMLYGKKEIYVMEGVGTLLPLSFGAEAMEWLSVCLWGRCPHTPNYFSFVLIQKKVIKEKIKAAFFPLLHCVFFGVKKNALRYAPFERFFAFFRKTLRYALRSKNEAIPPSFLSFHLFSESKRRFARF